MQIDKYIRFDWAMKRMLRDKANFDVLEGLLTVLLDEEITIVELLESEGNQQDENDKFNRVDIKAKDSKGEIIIIEIQNSREIYFLERILYGVANAITEHMYLGDTYKDVKKIISISILYFDLGKGADYLYHGQNRFVGVHTGDELVVTEKQRSALGIKSPQEIFPDYYLIRVNEFNTVARTPLEEWIEYLKTGRINDDTQAPGLQAARQKLLYYNMSAPERQAYDAHINNIMIQNDVISNSRAEGYHEGEAAGRAEGYHEGEAAGRAAGHAAGVIAGALKARQDMARALKASGVAPDIIVNASGLTKEEIDRL